MDVCGKKDIHGALTHRSGLSYCFTPKHHGGGPLKAARWLASLERSEEFGVFDMADEHQLKDFAGNLYGVLIKNTSDGRMLFVLGTRNEQVARFWFEGRLDSHWHGYPIYPCNHTDKQDEGRTTFAPPKEIFARLASAGLISQAKAARLKSGRHVGKLGD